MNLIHITKRLVLGIFFSILGSFLGLIMPLVLRQFINLKSFNFSSIPKSLIIFGISLILLDMITSTLSTYLISSSGDIQVKNIRLTLQKKTLLLPQSYFDKELSGNLTSRLINDIGILRSFVTETIPSTITGIITILGTIIITFILDWKLTILMILVFPLDGLISIPLGKINEKIANQSQESLGNLTGNTSESLQNIKTIKLSNAEEYVYNKIQRAINSLFTLSLKTDKIIALTGPLQSMVSLLLILIVVLYGTLRVKNGALSTGTLAAFMIYFFQIIGPINEVAMFYTDAKQVKGATQKIQEIMSSPIEENISLPKREVSNNTFKLVLKNVDFSYNKKKILEDINLSVCSKQKIALVGATGAGKSTIVNIITRLYPINSGKILLNNLSATDFGLKQWRSFFSVVSQENTILSGTIRDNLILGLATIPNDNQLWQALEIAELASTVNKLPQKLDSFVGEQGIALSGGQRQRLQIARAYLRNFKFLILDEATSSLDSDTEKKISDSLDKIIYEKNCGLITIAHRLSTIKNSDMIYFIKDGHIIKSGNHSELMRTVPDYARYVKEQEILEDNSYARQTN